jgi:hypothetical protein
MDINYILYIINIILLIIILKNININFINKLNNNRLSDIGEVSKLNLVHYNEYIPQNISVIRLNDTMIVANIRYINYRMVNDKIFVIKNGQYLLDSPLINKNAYVYFNNNMEIMSDIKFMDNNLKDIESNNKNIIGLEDIRLYKQDNILKYIATSTEYSYDSKSKMVIGDYNLKLDIFDNNKKIYSPTKNDLINNTSIDFMNAEKNWISVENKFIYKWYPLQVGELDNDNLKITIINKMPYIFNGIRGSTNFIEYNGNYLLIVHKLKFNIMKRVYVHYFVLLEKNTFKLLRYSNEFIFINPGIEYCLSMILNNNKLYMFVSINDADPVIINIDVDYIEDLLVF